MDQYTKTNTFSVVISPNKENDERRDTVRGKLLDHVSTGLQQQPGGLIDCILLLSVRGCCEAGQSPKGVAGQDKKNITREDIKIINSWLMDDN